MGQWVSESVSDSFKLGDSYLISELCELVLINNFCDILISTAPIPTSREVSAALFTNKSWLHSPSFKMTRFVFIISIAADLLGYTCSGKNSIVLGTPQTEFRDYRTHRSGLWVRVILGQFYTGQFDTADNLTPRTIWHRGQFDTRTIWHRTIWHRIKNISINWRPI